MLRIYLFGPPRFDRDGASIHISRRKGVALLSYLAHTNQPASRETLATLLWPEHDQTEALKSLRRELSRLRKALGGEVITATPRQMSINKDGAVIVDSIAFQSRLQLVHLHGHFPKVGCSTCLESLTTAVDLYSDDFMAGFTLPRCPEFDDWQYFQRETLRQEVGQAFRKLTTWFASQQEEDRVVHYARHWLAMDPLHEPARRALMRAYAHAGKVATALQAHEDGVQLLQEELGITPSEETMQLAEAIREGRFPVDTDKVVPDAERSVSMGTVRRRQHSNLPQQPTPFVGRSHELTMIQLRLQEPACRLLTLVGPGGIGKTRLALEVGERIWNEGNSNFQDGVIFVPLAPLSSTERIPSAILEAACIPPLENIPAKHQLLDYLQDKKMLLILDNLDHLVEGSDIITEMIVGAPGVRLLVTSRAALKLVGEWFHPVGGLPFPSATAAAKMQRSRDLQMRAAREYDAVRLFEQCAARASPEFRIEKELKEVVRICRLVEGMPLAIELAAAWLKVISTHAVANELEHNLDLLNSRFRNVPERHQSIHIVFDQTWSMLEPAERDVLARLSVFRGGFTREAAAQIAGASVFLLSSLIEKALLHPTTHGHFRLHELLRQFAAEKLGAMHQTEESYSDHSRYYLERLESLASELKGNDQRNALQQIQTDLENIRQAWKWALKNNDVPMLVGALEGIFLYFFLRGENWEGVEFFEVAREAYKPCTEQVGSAIWCKVTSRICLMKSHIFPAPTDIGKEIEISLATAKEMRDPKETAFCYLVRANYRMVVQSDPIQALSDYEQAHMLYCTLDEPFFLAQTLIWKGFCYGNLSRIDLYSEFSREGLALSRAIGHKPSIAHALSKLVIGAFWVGDYASAEAQAREMEAIGEELNLPGTITHAKMQLCLNSFLRGDIEETGRLARESHKLALEIHYPPAISYTLSYSSLHASITGNYATGKELARESLDTPQYQSGVLLGLWALAIANCGLGRDDEAWEQAASVLQRAYDGGYPGIATWPLPVLAIVLTRRGENERAVELLALAQTHPLSPTGWQHEWPLLRDTIGELEANMGPEYFASAWERGRFLEVDTVFSSLTEYSEQGISPR